MTATAARVPPLPAGTLCTLDGRRVRAYARIWPGEAWDGRYRCIDIVHECSTIATREQLQPIGGGQ